MENKNILFKPTVYLVASQVINEDELGRFLGDENSTFTPDTKVAGEVLAETAGRICYMSYGKGRKTNREYLEHIISSHHGSVLEHVVWSFVITGISRSLTHELIRHRAGFGFSQLSQRYVDESAARYVCPPLYKDCPELLAKWESMVEKMHKMYCELSDDTTKYVDTLHPELPATDRRKLARQSACSVLPNATETKMVVTANARAWRHFVEMRGNVHADTEIRILAVEIAKVLKNEAPNIFQDIEIVKEGNIEEVRAIHSKV